MTDFRNQSNFHVSCRNKGALLSLGVFIPNCWVQSFFEEKISNAPRAKSSFFGNGRNFFTFRSKKRVEKKTRKGQKMRANFQNEYSFRNERIIEKMKVTIAFGYTRVVVPSQSTQTVHELMQQGMEIRYILGPLTSNLNFTRFEV